MKTSNLHAEQAFESIEHRGEWWLPEHYDQKCFGNIYIIPKENQQKLILLGSFEDNTIQNAFQMGGKYPVIHGRISSGDNITIFDAICTAKKTSFNTPDLCETTISFSEMWIGPELFSNQEELKFENFIFSINNLELWHNQNNFEYNPEDKIIKYNPPEKLILFEDNLVSISLGYRYSTHLGVSVTSFEQATRIFVQAKQEKIPFYGKTQSCLFYIDLIYSLFSIFIGENPFIYSCIGVAQNGEINNGHIQQPKIAYTRYWRRSLPKEMPKKNTFLDIHFPYNLLNKQLQLIISCYAEKYKSIERLGSLVFKLIANQQIRQYDDSSLPEMFYIFEGIMETLYKSEVTEQHNRLVNIDEFEKKRSKILSICPEELKTWLNNQLPSYPMSNDRIAAAFITSSVIFSFISEEQYNQIFKYIRKARNLYSHGSKSKIENWELYIPITMWLRQLITSLILNKCNCEINVIKKCYENNHYYNNLKLTLPALLSSLNI